MTIRSSERGADPRVVLALALWCFVLGTPGNAFAQTPTPSEALQQCFDDLGLPSTLDGRPVETPSVGPYYGLRLMGMGGAFTAVAEGIEAVPYTLSALANRRPQQGDWFGWDATLTWVVPANLLDVDYNGCPTRSSVRLLAGGGLLRFGRIGVGAFIDQVTFFGIDDGSTTLTVLRSTAGVAWALPGDAFVVGVGLHTLSYMITTGDSVSAEALALATGANVLWRPPGERFRLGASVRLPQVARVEGGGVDGVPEALVDPWNFTVGAAWWVGEGQLNQRIPHVDGDAGNPPAIDGMLLTSDLVLVVPRKVAGRDAGGLEAYFEGRTQVVNPRPTLGLRVGTETEPVADRVRMRGGLWLEPSRFAGISPRLHITGGLDVRLFKIYGQAIRGSLAFDLAAGYSISSISVGFW